jgi:superfamily II DNA or RNA helicase
VAGDYHLGDLSERMGALVGNVVDTWLARAGGRRTVVFGVDISHSAALCREFVAKGIPTEHVDAGTPVGERRTVFGRFRSGATQVLTNCMLASYGFDLPELDCVVLARPTKSLVLFLQMLGRGLRPAPGKTDCLVLDHSGAVHRHGFADEDRYWTLDGHEDLSAAERQRSNSDAAPKMVTCPECRCVFTERSDCPSCGYFFPAKARRVNTLEGELVQVGDRREREDVFTQRRFYAQLLGIASERGWKPGAAAHRFKEKFGKFPPWEWKNSVEPQAASLEVARWVKSRCIAYAKRVTR